MVKVKATFNKDYLQKLEVSGHADSGEHGQDLVCAGVSSIVFGTLNALTTFDLPKNNIQIKENEIIIDNDGVSKDCNIILETTLIQLKTIEQSEYNYIVIEESK